MSCLFTHKWVMEKVVDVTSRVRTDFPYRICERCGTMQRGFDTFDGDIAWETIRANDYWKSQQIQIVRQPFSPFDQLTHTLGLRQTRMSDKWNQETTPRRSNVSQPKSDREQHTPFRQAWTGANLTDQLERPEMTGRPAERRRSKRIDVALPVILENATGVTRDVSASGVFFWKSGTFVYGESISFSMERKTESGKFMQKCRGVVARTEPRDNDIGVGVEITKTEMEPIKDVMAHAEGVSGIRPGGAA
jgi:hypothetical protein